MVLSVKTGFQRTFEPVQPIAAALTLYQLSPGKVGIEFF